MLRGAAVPGESGGGCEAELGMRGEAEGVGRQTSIRMWVSVDLQG